MTTSRDLMDRIDGKVRATPGVAAHFNAVYRFVLEGEAGDTYRLNLKDAPGIERGDGPADCTITLADSDFVDLLEGRANGQELFFQGKLRLEGDMMLALKLENLARLAQ